MPLLTKHISMGQFKKTMNTSHSPMYYLNIVSRISTICCPGWTLTGDHTFRPLSPSAHFPVSLSTPQNISTSNQTICVDMSADPASVCVCAPCINSMCVLTTNKRQAPTTWMRYMPTNVNCQLRPSKANCPAGRVHD